MPVVVAGQSAFHCMNEINITACGWAWWLLALLGSLLLLATTAAGCPLFSGLLTSDCYSVGGVGGVGAKHRKPRRVTCLLRPSLVADSAKTSNSTLSTQQSRCTLHTETVSLATHRKILVMIFLCVCQQGETKGCTAASVIVPRAPLPGTQTPPAPHQSSCCQLSKRV